MNAEYRMKLAPVDIGRAEGAAKEVLETARAQVGFVPNMYAAMVNSPALLSTYLGGYKAFREESGFTPAEQEAVFLTISRQNGCAYCVAAHSMLARHKSNLDEAVTTAIREGRAIDDPKLGALARFTRIMLEKRGLPSNRDVQAFLAAGYAERHIMDIILAIAIKTLSNYSNHLFHTQLDSIFAPFAWSEEPVSSAA